MSASQLEVLNPVADLSTEKQQNSVAPRPLSLEGKRVGLYWNYKPGGNHALERIKEALEASHKGIQVKMYAAPRPVPQKVLEAIKTECDVTVGATGD